MFILSSYLFVFIFSWLSALTTFWGSLTSSRFLRSSILSGFAFTLYSCLILSLLSSPRFFCINLYSYLMCYYILCTCTAFQ
ncbi:hypothetical protein BDQ12DRAFT_324253 [Crucibulum laeve]|uniref:Uncharacterized protein n=1 Tax=Crucibulum laeve TaxID=68775 RepID=A0A5C3M273_9AGAR|nr:hypothetical protein BDQ12DRAFT_324253 [Crucibulum laeve]